MAEQTEAEKAEAAKLAEANKAKAKPKGKTETDERFVAASESRFQPSAEFVSPMVSYTPVSGTPLDHLLRPEYWANLKQLKTGCRIWVVAEDGAYWAELYVLRVGQGYAKVQVLRQGELDQATIDPALSKEYEIQFRGPVMKHRVVRLKDGHVLKEQLETVEEAQAWLRDHKRMLAA